MATFTFTQREGTPQKHVAPPVARQGHGNAQAWTGLERNDSTSLTRWAAHAARRRWRRTCFGRQWRQGGDQ